VYNKIILIGNLTKDPEIRYAQSGLPVCNFSIAVNYTTRKNEDKKETLFINVVTFDRQAEICGQFLRKGKPVLVEGRLQERRWETEDGQQRSRVEVVAQTVKFFSRRMEESLKEDDLTPPEESTVEDPF
jgi:single-strand DNA-binding protein